MTRITKRRARTNSMANQMPSHEMERSPKRMEASIYNLVII